ncbi:16S rRNA (adenine(1518)-N(6)/adenine(1519)-N(6))-dimethyltransferase RsmA [Brevibacterium sp. 91QC2O2]|uniref:16S rRNA (adenine(1518)-N(6)/adenine(1519)-N(6))- dimethyltransferase RsmA n=1 Tax=Brevibacterium sp. 91QC2O2 TaxID=2968458 RepID=UPI00211CA7DD|nr:16S rRNA (adenine(1518)-N(6)/adenine(1519)-N(6))-dimethyltransferase RsmA [Brevibacterium sp. 91QC2O2]
MSELLTAATIRALAAELGLRPTKQRGQNFVIDPNTVRKIVAEAALEPGQPVVEVGPGLGSLTLGLLDAGHPVTAVEIDGLLAGRLPATVAEHAGPGARFALVEQDALRVAELPEAEPGRAPSALVANLPYNVAVPVLLHMLETFPTLRRVLVMVQAEVADRLAAVPGSRVYGVPSVKAQWYGTVDRGSDIGKNVFWPAPNVGSGLVGITVHPTALDDPAGEAGRAGVSRREVFTLIDAAFAQRRKSLRAALSGWVGSGARAGEVLQAAGIDPLTRGERLDVHDFVRIAAAGRTIVPAGGPAPAVGPTAGGAESL